MRLSRTKSVITGAAFALMLMFSIGMVTATTAQAQDRNNRWDRNQRADRSEQRDSNRDRGDWNRRQQIERQRAIERARQLAWQREQARSRSYNYPRNYPQYGGYGNGGYGDNRGYGNYGGYGDNRGYGNNGGYGGGYNNYDVQRGYSDGLNRGQEDSRDRRSPNPNNSSHFRSGNSAYREGFVRGYQVGYRQYGGGRRW